MLLRTFSGSLILASSAMASDFWLPNHHGPGSSEIHFGCGDAECTLLSLSCEKSGTMRIGIPFNGNESQDGQQIPIEIKVGSEQTTLTGTIGFMGGNLSASAPASELVFRAMRTSRDITIKAGGEKLTAPLGSLGKGRTIFLNACGVPKQK